MSRAGIRRVAEKETPFPPYYRGIKPFFSKEVDFFIVGTRINDFTFFEAAKLVQRQRSDVTFLAVGDGPTLAHYQNIYDRYPGIVFTGRRNDAKNLVQLFFVGVLCSYIERFPNAVIEYMALGKPVVVTDGGGIRELVLDGQTGYVVPASTPQSCEEKILILLDNPEMAQDMGMSGLLRIGEKVPIRTAIENL